MSEPVRNRCRAHPDVPAYRLTNDAGDELLELCLACEIERQLRTITSLRREIAQLRDAFTRLESFIRTASVRNGRLQ
jgi:hypothetical protein